MNFYLYSNRSTDPCINLAAEEYLLDFASDTESVICFLWQNKNAVILGRNQNAQAEFNHQKADEYNVTVTRRITGGGCVYHDLGNLNFTFIAPAPVYDSRIMSDIIAEVISGYGIEVSVSGRNDIYTNNKKFSGNAYYKNSVCGLHHGTLLVASDIEKMNELLNTPNSKPGLKGVRSIKENVINISDLKNEITVNTVKKDIANVFCDRVGKVFGGKVIEAELTENDRIMRFSERYRDNGWVYRDTGKFNCSERMVFRWGEANVFYNQMNGIITEAEIFTDCINTEAVEHEKKQIIGRRL